MLYLCIGEITGAPPPSTRDLIVKGLKTMEMLVDLQKQGRCLGGGIMSGKMGLVFILDVADNWALNETVIRLPSFSTCEWQIAPLHSFQQDIDITRKVLDAMAKGADWRDEKPRRKARAPGRRKQRS